MWDLAQHTGVAAIRHKKSTTETGLHHNGAVGFPEVAGLECVGESAFFF